MEQAQHIFTTALRSIIEEASDVLHRPVEIATVSPPRHFNDSSQEAIIVAAMQIEPTMKQPWQVIDSVNAARLAYGLDTCVAFGFNEDACDMEEEVHLIVFMEYSPDYLELTVAEITENTCGIEGQRWLPALGLDHTPYRDTFSRGMRRTPSPYSRNISHPRSSSQVERYQSDRYQWRGARICIWRSLTLDPYRSG